MRSIYITIPKTTRIKLKSLADILYTHAYNVGPHLDYGLEGGTPKALKGFPIFALSVYVYVCL